MLGQIKPKFLYKNNRNIPKIKFTKTIRNLNIKLNIPTTLRYRIRLTAIWQLIAFS